MKNIKAVALLLALLLALGGCAMDIIGMGDPSAAAVFRYGYTEAWPETRNPLLDADGGGQILYYNQLYEPMADMGPDHTWRGRLAEDWSLAADELTWTFYLRKGVRWHDGEEFNADDVVATYRLVKELNLPVAAQIADIDKITRVDDYTVTIKTYAPKGEMLETMLPILPNHLYGGAQSMADLAAFQPHPVGTGPFRFVEEVVGRYVRYEANPGYWAGRPEMDLLHFTVCTHEEGVAALLEGALDYCPLDIHRLAELPTSASLWRHVYEADSLVILGYRYGDLTPGESTPLGDRQLRLALDQCFDFEAIAGAAPAAVTSQRSIVPGVAGDWSVDFAQDGGYRPYNPEAAASNLDKAGYTDGDGDGIREDKKGKPLIFTLRTTPDLGWAAELLAHNAAEIGIVLDIAIQALPWNGASAYDMSLYRQRGGLTNPTALLEGYTTMAESGYTGYASEEYDTLVRRAAENPWQEDGQGLVRQAQQVLYRDAPCAVLFQESLLEVCQSSLWQGWKTRFQSGGSVWCWETMLALRPD